MFLEFPVGEQKVHDPCSSRSDVVRPAATCDGGNIFSDRFYISYKAPTANINKSHHNYHLPLLRGTLNINSIN